MWRLNHVLRVDFKRELAAKAARLKHPCKVGGTIFLVICYFRVFELLWPHKLVLLTKKDQV